MVFLCYIEIFCLLGGVAVGADKWAWEGCGSEGGRACEEGPWQ